MKLTKNTKLREFIQVLGTDAMRKVIHPNIWVNALFSEFTDDSKWIITDVRFPNEVEKIKEKGGIIIRIGRPLYFRFPIFSEILGELNPCELYNDDLVMDKLKSKNYTKYTKIYKKITHESETALDDCGAYYDYDIYNNKSNDLSSLFTEAITLLNKNGIEYTH